MRFFAWLRRNSEHYLLVAAQGRIATRYGARQPAPPHGFTDRFFLSLFVPIYRRLPWSLRSAVIRSMPGSHRQQWTPRDRHTRRPAV
jgi:hypothetical protein